ncbi:MAG: VWA domain-containing protein [Gammaproteobacteria bacterium]|nr:VWA domain-containing protein [Gammaproteobacteria bacterium]
MSLFGWHWVLPMVLLLLPLALLPWFTHNQDKKVAWVAIVPVDPLSTLIGFSLKVLASVTIASLVLALAGPFVPEKKIERVAEGAEIVLLLDRSRSMDDAFAVKTQAALYTVGKKDSKRRVAKDYLTEFVKKRPDDRFGFVFFSSQAINLLPLTYSKEAVLATIDASALGKGLSNTNIAEALIKASDMFKGQNYRGSRIVLLVSDGGQLLEQDAQERIKELYKQENITVYWIYLKANQGMTLEEADGKSRLWADSPERKLHDFFNSIGQPYRAFEAKSLESFGEAMDEIDRQHYDTLIVDEILPRESKTTPFYVIALIAMLLLVMSQLYTVWGVRKAHE